MFGILVLLCIWGVSSVAQVDLKKMKDTQYIIITVPQFAEEAQRLATFHKTHSKLSVEVITVNNIYKSYPNTEKIASIRQFLKSCIPQIQSTEICFAIRRFELQGRYSNVAILCKKRHFI